MVQFKDLPEEIQERMLDEQVRQGNTRDTEVFEVEASAGFPEGGFTWGDSIEGHVFWAEIILEGNLSVFYKKYPKP